MTTPAVLSERSQSAAEAILGRPSDQGVTLALLALRNGQVLIDRYGRQPDTPFGPGGMVDESTTLISWSMAKSITHALIGLAMADGLIDPDERLEIDEWKHDRRSEITVDHLLQMRSGLAFVEDYVDGQASNTIEMLFSGPEHRGVADMGAYAAAQVSIARAGELFSYSSGTTNILTRLLGDRLAGGDATTVGSESRRSALERFARERLFGPLDMNSATLKFDASGTFVGSSFVYATARDFARFGEFYRLDGCGPGGTRLLPSGWRDAAREPLSFDPDGAGPHGFGYGRHWWIWPDLPGSMAAHGYQGQFILVLPESGVTIVHLGLTEVNHAPALVSALGDLARSLLDL